MVLARTTKKNRKPACPLVWNPATNDAVVTIDAAAIRHNVDYLRQMSKTDIMPVLKANAYGHGAVPVSKILRNHNVKLIGVATLGEALMLRKSGDSGRIVAWLYDVRGEDLKAAMRQNIDICVIDPTHVPMVCTLAANHGQKHKQQPVRVHMFVDTGINRAGIPYAEAVRTARELSGHAHVALVGLMSHFIQSSVKNDPTTHHQLQLFRDLRRTLLSECGIDFEHVHMANSGGCLNYDVSDFTLARPGLAVFGIDPNGTPNKHLRPAMTLESRIVQIKRIFKGDCVGYDKAFVAQKNMVICVAPIGYADGVPRSASGRLHVVINGTRRKVLGTISMDQIVMEAVPHDAVGDSVLLFGASLQTIYDVARAANTIPYEVITHVNSSKRAAVKYLNL